MDIYAIREAIAATVNGLALQDGYEQLIGTAWTPDAVTPPHFFVAEYEIDYNQTMRSLTKVQFTCRVLVGASDDQWSQQIVDSMFNPNGATSLKAAIEAARDVVNGGFGGLVDDFRVTRMQGNRKYTHEGIDYVGGEVIIEVMGE